MSEEKRNKLLIVLDIFFLTIITLGLGFCAIHTKIIWYVSEIIPQLLVCILVFVILWIVLMVKKWKSLKNIHVKILITWPVIVMSALVLYALIVLALLYSIRDAFY